LNSLDHESLLQLRLFEDPVSHEKFSDSHFSNWFLNHRNNLRFVGDSI
jgi:hypothetical protein